MIVIETERLDLRRITLEDAEFIHQLYNEPAFRRNIGDKNIKTVEDATKFIENSPLQDYKKQGFSMFLVALRSNNTPIGVCGLLKREYFEEVDLGFAFLEAYWSKGYGREAASSVMEYARTDMGLGKLVGITSAKNTSSIKLLERLKFVYDRTLTLPGYEGDSKLFAITL